MSANSLIVYLVAVCAAAVWIYLGSLMTTDPVGDLPPPVSTVQGEARP